MFVLTYRRVSVLAFTIELERRKEVKKDKYKAESKKRFKEKTQGTKKEE